MTEKNTGPGRVLVILHEPQLGGASQSVLRACEVLSCQGWEFVFWVPRPSSLFDDLCRRGLRVGGAPRYIDFGLRSLFAPPGPRQRLASLRPYLRALREFAAEVKPDLVHANSVTTLVEGLALRGRGVLLHVHEMVPGGLRGNLIRRGAWQALGCVVAVSEACASTMTLGANTPRVVFEAAPIPPEPVPTRAENDRFSIGSIGVISTRKGSDLFVAAAKLARQKDFRLRFELVGLPSDERDRAWGKQVIQSASRAGIKCTPRVDISDAFARWDAFVLPSRQDPFPIVMLEAMAHGLPVIGTEIDGIAEQIAPGCGVLVPPDDAEALARAMVRMANTTPSERSAMGLAARQRVASNFTVERQAASLADAYVTLRVGD